MNVPPRWQSLIAFFEVLLEPLCAAEPAGTFLIEACGPDGSEWNVLRPVGVPLAGTDAPLRAAREVARQCGASAACSDPGPASQGGCGVYYVPSALRAGVRSDRQVLSLGAIALDIDDRDHDGRAGSAAALELLPRPTALVHSGGGLQAVYVLREALRFDRDDERALREAVFSYVRVALPLQAATGADQTAWPSHLFRCPGTYHLKNPARPVLVTVELDAGQRFNLSDFTDLAAPATDSTVETHAAQIVARLLGTSPTKPAPPVRARSRPDRITLPRRVSPAIVRLLNTGQHEKYARADGSIDRSRAVCAAATSLLGAGLSREAVAEAIACSAIRTALDDRGPSAERWLTHQIDAAEKFLRGRMS